MYELIILPFRELIKQTPLIGERSRKTNNAASIRGIWKSCHTELFNELKQAILDQPCLMRPDCDRRMYCKTDWSSRIMGAAICQADTNIEALRAKAAENEGGKCVFDLTKSNVDLRLRSL